MTEWQIKEISELTKTSVRMLRHYDKIGLLKPSYRASNGYRCYTEQDLAKLQQIIALKYFGFSLKTIKAILQKHHNIYAHLQAQQQVLKKQSQHLEQVNEALGNILKSLSPSEIPNWTDIIALIERYHMSDNLRAKLKQSWMGKRLNESQFEEYLSLYEEFPDEFAERDKIIAKINNNELGDPEGPDGERIMEFMFDFRKKIQKLSAKMLKVGCSLLEEMQSGKLTQLEVTPEGTLWISRATLSYWLKRWDALYQTILENLKSDPKGKIGKEIASNWNEHCTQFRVSFTSEEIEEAKAEEEFNLEVYFPLRVALRRLALKNPHHALLASLQSLLTSIETDEVNTQRSSYKFKELTQKYRTPFLDLIGQVDPQELQEHTGGAYLSMQVDERCMLQTLVNEQLKAQIDRPIDEMLKRIPDDLEEKLPEGVLTLKEQLSSIKDQRHSYDKKRPETILMRLCNQDTYEKWVLEQIKLLQDMSLNPKLKEQANTFNFIAELTHWQFIAHKHKYTPKGKAFQEAIELGYQMLKVIDRTNDVEVAKLVTTLQKQIKDVDSDTQFVQDIFKNSLSKEPPTKQPPSISRPKRWPWILGGVLLFAGIIVSNAVPGLNLALNLAAKHWLYVGIGLSLVSSVALQKNTEYKLHHNAKLKWISGFIAFCCFAGAIAINVIPGLGQAISATLLFVGFSVLNIAAITAGGFLAASSYHLAHVPKPDGIPRQRPTELYAYPYDAEAAVAPTLSRHAPPPEDRMLRRSAPTTEQQNVERTTATVSLGNNDFTTYGGSSSPKNQEKTAGVLEHHNEQHLGYG